MLFFNQMNKINLFLKRQQDHLSQSGFVQWCGQIYWREAILCVPAIVVVLALSSILTPVAAVIMLSAAFSIGFGASRALAGHRWGAMGAAVIGMALAAFIGSLVGNYPWLMIALIALLAAICAALASYNNDWWWVMLQIIVAFMVAGYYPNKIEHAALRSGLVLSGGSLQIICTMILAHFSPKSAVPLPSAQPITHDHWLRFVFATALAVAMALYSAQSIGLKNDYWAPMSALLILRPAAKDTLSRGINRLIGTLAGCAAATVIIYIFHDSLSVLIFFLLLTVASAFAMQKAHYALYSGTVSATIVFLIAIGHGDPISTTEHRLIATLLGGAVAIVIGRVFRL